MSARIAVLSGVSRGTEIGLAGDMLRLGSHPGCDVSIPDPKLPAHAATLELRNGQYILHNRTGGAVGLGGQTLASAASAVWPSGADLQLTPDLVLRLLTGDAQAPVSAPQRGPAPAASAAPSLQPGAPMGAAPSGAAPAAGAPAADKSRQTVQMAVIGFCVLAALLVVLGGSGDESVATTATFDQMVQELQSAGTEQAGTLRRLQAARTAEQREDWVTAGDEYKAVRDTLYGKRLRDKENSLAGLDEKVWNYVVRRLRFLNE